MKHLTKKQKWIIALVIGALLVGAYFWGYRPNRTDERITPEEIAELKEKENSDLISLKKEKPKEEEEKVEDKPSFEITSFIISSDIEEAKPGETINFTGYFDGRGEFERKINWSIVGKHHEGTTINEEGLLTISAEETQSKLLIKGISLADEERVQEKSVRVLIEKKEIVKPTTKEELKELAEEQQSEITEEEKAKTEADAKQIKKDAIAATSGGAKDKYQTSAVPEGKPKPVEPGEVEINKEVEHRATISISCETILDNMDIFNMDKIDMLPLDGIILGTIEVVFYEGESVYDVLQRVTREKKIHMESVFTPMFNSAYVEGINNLYEFDCGELSGWMYKVNEWFPNYGCSRYILEEGDVINWVYTCSLGTDVGDNSMTQGN